jgi:hypothetical protein
MTTATTTTGLNLRTGPGTQFSVIQVLPPQTVCEVLAAPSAPGDWLHVRALGQEGFVNRKFVVLAGMATAPGFITTPPAGHGSGDPLAGTPPAMQTPLAPPAGQLIVLGPQANGADRQAANAWNKYGGLLAPLAAQLSFDPGAAVAVLAIESGGRGFAADGRMIIRFENHLFFRQWGKDHADTFNQFFSFNPQQNWLDHQWRPSASQPFRSFHGSQDGEWQVFSFARNLDDTAAKLSISMGGPQIVGFNYAGLGYESVHQMFDAFTSGDRPQIIGFFDFVQGPGRDSRRVLALQAGDFTTFASLYNGPGQAAKYGSLMQSVFDTFRRLKPA